MRRLLPLALLTGCVALTPSQLPRAPGAEFPPPEPAHAAVGRRFVVTAWDADAARRVLESAERDYDRVMAHTGLWSYRPEGLYPVVVYRDPAEYLAKTGQPGWSGGVAAGNAVYTYDGPELEETLAHEVAHLVFLGYMGGGRPVWLNEGLAVFEEIQASRDREARLAELALARIDPIPFAEMVAFAPLSERGRGINSWYRQSASVTAFLVERGGPGGIASLLGRLKAGSGLDAAVAAAVPTLCDSLACLEEAWRRQ